MDGELDVACHLNVLVSGLDDPGLESALAALAELGYSRVVLPPVDPDALDVGWLRDTVARHGLIPIPIAGQAPEADVSSPNPRVREAGADLLRRMVQLTVDLGGDQLNGVPYGLFGHPTAPLTRQALERSATSVGQVADEAAEQGITMTFEVVNRYETSAINTAKQAVEYVGLSGSENLRVHLDTFHMAVEETDMAEAVRMALPVLGFLELGQSGRGHLGAGAVDVGEIVRVALDGGYDGPFGVEAFSRQILSPEAGDMLAIWRDRYDDGVAVAAEAMRLVSEASTHVRQ